MFDAERRPTTLRSRDRIVYNIKVHTLQIHRPGEKSLRRCENDDKWFIGAVEVDKLAVVLMFLANTHGMNIRTIQEGPAFAVFEVV